MICEAWDDKNLAAVEQLLGKEIPRLDNPITGAKSQVEIAGETPAENKPKRQPRRRKPEPFEAVKEVKEVASVNQKPEPKPTPSTPAKKSGGRGGKQGKDVVGMGDHMPSFIAQSLDDRRAG